MGNVLSSECPEAQCGACCQQIPLRNQEALRMAFDATSVLTLDQAMLGHQLWKSSLQNAVESGEKLDVALIRRDDCCDLGKWLQSDGRVAYGHSPEFSKLLDIHNEFHLVTSVVANIINGKDYEQAKTMLDGSSQFSSASREVALAILRLKAFVQKQVT
jgi:hypothetical protein